MGGGTANEIRSRRRCRSACVLKSSVGPGYSTLCRLTYPIWMSTYEHDPRFDSGHKTVETAILAHRLCNRGGCLQEDGKVLREGPCEGRGGATQGHRGGKVRAEG
jgi:hypothetical protein